MSEPEVFDTIYQAIFAALESRLHLIGSVISADAGRLTIDRKIYDKGDFYNAIGHLVTQENDSMTLHVGSNVRHEPYVLGGKVPSWTPIAPLIAWVQRKGLSWVDPASGARLSVEAMAYAIRGAIKKRGIAPRNIFAEIIRNREDWIYAQLNSIEVAL